MPDTDPTAPATAIVAALRLAVDLLDSHAHRLDKLSTGPADTDADRYREAAALIESNVDTLTAAPSLARDNERLQRYAADADKSARLIENRVIERANARIEQLQRLLAGAERGIAERDAERDGLLAALRPFAEAATAMPDERFAGLMYRTEAGETKRIPAEAFRRAAEVIAALDAGKPAEGG